MIEKIMERANEARRLIKQDPILGQFVDTTLAIPQPYIGNDEIKLIVIGQDPTVKNARNRHQITTVLMLDKDGSLRRYLHDISQALGISSENIFATNFCKSFFTAPPTIIKKQYKVDVLEKSAAWWLPILQDEVALFPHAAIISLGEPVVSVLTQQQGRVRDYWGYAQAKKGLLPQYSFISSKDNVLGRNIYPFCHQPTLGKSFYRQNLTGYLKFVRDSHDF